MYKRIASFLVLLVLPGSLLLAAEWLPEVKNARVVGNTLVWDSQPEAAGYNIYRDYKYLDTVRGGSAYELSEPGYYDVLAFDEEGNFGGQFDYHIQFVPEVDANMEIVMEYYTAIVEKRCSDVNAGESCIATCPTSLEQDGAIVYTKYLSGGACSTSAEGGADAAIADRSYHCTVQSFSEQVTVQGICVIRSR